MGALAGGIAPVRAQNAGTSTAAEIAERLDMEERYKNLSSAIDGLDAANKDLQRRLSQLAAEVRELREQMGKQPANVATQDQIKRLADAILDVENERKKDKEFVKEKIKELAQTLKNAPPPAPPVTHSKPPPEPIRDTTPPKPEKGFEYVIQSGDTASKIIEAYRKEGVKVTLKQIQEANPGIKFERLKVGQKIFIPAPEK